MLRIAGQLSWVSGILKWVRGFNACLWAAILAHVAERNTTPRVSNKKRPTHLFFVLRIQSALAWIRSLLAGAIRNRDGHQ